MVGFKSTALSIGWCWNDSEYSRIILRQGSRERWAQISEGQWLHYWWGRLVIYGIFMSQRVFQRIANVYAWLRTHGKHVENNLVYALRGFSYVASVFLCCYLH
jgi:hypothetical protein